ncbi:MAG: M20/M25/M40 family metallo-hydrolase, partial [Bryobacterales bacterium]|nr:M20/M25/M40 family metallo-hydrolase [Bryobacterales bacterium]
GQISASPCASNVIPGSVSLSLDVRHAIDMVRHKLAGHLMASADQMAKRRCLKFVWEPLLDQPAVAMDTDLVKMLESAVASSGRPVLRMPSGAGHDAMIVARRIPAAMLFLRSPGGISHHPDETVHAHDVAAAIEVGMWFLEDLERRYA